MTTTERGYHAPAWNDMVLGATMECNKAENMPRSWWSLLGIFVQGLCHLICTIQALAVRVAVSDAVVLERDEKFRYRTCVAMYYDGG